MSRLAIIIGVIALLSHNVASLQLRQGAAGVGSQVYDTIVEFANSMLSVASIRPDSVAGAMTNTLITNFHLQSLEKSFEASSPAAPKVGANAVLHGDPEAAPTSYLKKKLYVARNACTTGAIMTYGESVGMNTCYPAAANLTSYNIFTTNGSAVTVSTYATSACSGTPLSSYSNAIGCDDNGFYTLAVNSKKGWGSSVGFGYDVYTTKSGCKNNNGVLTGGVIISTSPTGCYSSTNSTSNGVSCSGGNLNYLTYSQLQCKGTYTTQSVPKTSNCNDLGLYGYAYGYPYIKCYNL